MDPEVNTEAHLAAGKLTIDFKSYRSDVPEGRSDDAPAIQTHH